MVSTTVGTPPRPELVAHTGGRQNALELARRIQMPRTLPVTYKGEPLRCLSDSSIKRFLTCPDDWRRHYLKGERFAPTGAMFLGSRLDDAQSAYYREQIQASGPLSAAQLRECFLEQWNQKLGEEEERYGPVRWEEGMSARRMQDIGVEALEVFLKSLVPHLGEPQHTQRDFEFRLDSRPDSGLEWTVVGKVDLDVRRQQRCFLSESGETWTIEEADGEPAKVIVPWPQAPADLRPPLQKRDDRHTDGQAALYQPPVLVAVSALRGVSIEREVDAIVDFKAKNTAMQEYHADRDPQATLYLAERELIAEAPAYDFTFAQVLKPKDGKRKRVTSKLTRTRRERSQLEAFLARVAMVAVQIDTLYRTLGPDRPWGFAAYGTWKCEPNSTRSEGKYCPFWASCPGGIGLGG